jgi:hypothetical protein
LTFIIQSGIIQRIMTLTGITIPEVHSYSTADRQDSVVVALTRFQPDGTSRSSELTLATPSPDYTTKDFTRLRQEARNITTSDDGNFELTVLNRETAQGNLAHVALAGWGSDLHSVSAQRELIDIAAQNKDHLVIASQPVRMSRPVRNELMHYGSYLSLGEQEYGVMEPYLQGSQKVRFSGHSEGGRRAIALANASEIPVESVTISDPPGSRELTYLGLAYTSVMKTRRHSIAERRKGGWRESDQFDASLSEVAREVRKGLGAWCEAVDHFLQSLVFEPMALGHSGLFKDLNVLAQHMKQQNIGGEIHYLSPENSELNRVGDIAKIMADIAMTGILTTQGVLTGYNHTYPERSRRAYTRLMLGDFKVS